MSIKDYLGLKNPERTVQEIVTFIQAEVEDYSADGVIFGLSGGIDSSLVAYCLSRALPKEKIQAIYMGERDSSKESIKHARLTAKILV